MKKIKSDSNDDMFCTFLIKERELEYVERNHAKAAIKQMAKDFQENEQKATFITKIKDFFQDYKDSKTLKKIKKEAEAKILLLSDEEKSNKELEHKKYKHGDFNTHIFFEQKLTNKNIIADCGGISYPIMEYDVYIRIEFINAEIWTEKHLYKTFESLNAGKIYFNILKNKYKDKSAKYIIDYLTEKIDKHCDELNKRITSFNC